eukprot:365358-Chlamydomonas_euryale.AAC.5
MEPTAATLPFHLAPSRPHTATLPFHLAPSRPHTATLPFDLAPPVHTPAPFHSTLPPPVHTPPPSAVAHLTRASVPAPATSLVGDGWHRVVKGGRRAGCGVGELDAARCWVKRQERWRSGAAKGAAAT